MAPVPGIERLPTEHRAWLLGQWRRTGYGAHEDTANALNARLAADGIDEEYSTSTLWRWAKAEKARGARIRYTAELRAATIAALPDDDPGLAEKVGAYVEGRIVEALEDLDHIEDLAPMDRLSALVDAAQANTSRRRALTAAQRADLDRAKFEAAEAIRKQAIEQAAERVGAAAEARGLSAEDAKFWREQVLQGI